MANADNAYIGAAYESHVRKWLDGHGFDIEEGRARHPSGVQFDIDCTDLRGIRVGVECKASNPGVTSPGMARSDNRWKVLGYLYALRRWRLIHPEDEFRYVLVTSDLPVPSSDIRNQLDAAELDGELTVILLPWDGWEPEPQPLEEIHT